MAKNNTLSFLLVLIIICLSFSCKTKPTETPPLETKITGKVLDKTSNSALSGAVITTNPTTSSVTTDANGNYTIPDVSAGQYTVTAAKDGYGSSFVTVTVTEGNTVNADIQLETLKPQLAVSSEVIDFDVADNNKTFTITNQNKIGTVTWQISKDQPWLSVTPTSGTVTTETKIISVAVNRDSVSFGNYSSTITVSSDAGTKTISVLMVKVNPNAPQLTVTPPQLDFGSSQSSSTITIKNTGTGTINWTVTKSEAWILPSVPSGSTTNLSPSSVTISVDRNGLVVNNYSGTVTVNSNAGNQTVAIKMEVASGSIPAPVLQLVSKTQTSITIGWTKATSTSFASYKIYRSAVGGVTESATLLTTITNANTNTYTDNGLNNSTTYYYKVYIYNTANIGSGSNEISATTDIKLGTWVVQKQISGVNFTSFYANTDNDAWSIGNDASSNGKIYHWDGSDWNVQSIPIVKSLSDISFASSNDGWCVGEDANSKIAILHYNGIAWTKDTIPSSNLYGYRAQLNVRSSNNIWVIRSNAVYKFDGSKWTKTELGIGGGTYSSLTAISFVNDNEGWVISNDGKVFIWNGIGWGKGTDAPTYGYSGDQCLYSDLEVINSSEIWAMGRITDFRLQKFNGNSWQSILTQNNEQIYGYSIQIVNSSLGWIVGGFSQIGSASAIYRYDGTYWTEVSSPTNSVLYKVFMLNANSGWAVGYGGVILRYQ